MELTAVVLAAVLSAVLHSAQSCGGGGGGGGGGSGGSGGSGSGGGGDGPFGDWQAFKDALEVPPDYTMEPAEFAGGDADSAPGAGSDLECEMGSIGECKWKNRPDGDKADFYLVSGKPHPDRWSELTGGGSEPEGDFAVCGFKEAKGSKDGCDLVSGPIECQPADGMATLRAWKSVARSKGAEPKLQMCAVPEGGGPDKCGKPCDWPSPDEALCELPGPIFGPFRLAVRANNFVNKPEGGFIAIEKISYEGEFAPDNAPCEEAEAAAKEASKPKDGGGDGGGGSKAKLLIERINK